MNEALRNALLQGKRRPPLRAAGTPLQYRGDGYEFAELRAYVPGDDYRRIDWAATARTGELQTRVMLEEISLTLALVVDDSASMECGRRMPLREAACEIAAQWRNAALPHDRFHELGGIDAARAQLPYGSALLAIGDLFFFDAIERDVLFELSDRLDCTALLAQDPWMHDLPLSGFVSVADSEDAGSALLYFGKRERERYARISAERTASAIERIESAGWRAATFTEETGVAALHEAFGVRADVV